MQELLGVRFIAWFIGTLLFIRAIDYLIVILIDLWEKYKWLQKERKEIQKKESFRKKE